MNAPKSSSDIFEIHWGQQENRLCQKFAFYISEGCFVLINTTLMWLLVWRPMIGGWSFFLYFIFVLHSFVTMHGKWCTWCIKKTPFYISFFGVVKSVSCCCSVVGVNHVMPVSPACQLWRQWGVALRCVTETLLFTPSVAAVIPSIPVYHVFYYR